MRFICTTILKLHAPMYSAPRSMQAAKPLERRTKAGKTALHLAAAHGQVEVVKALLQAGADTTARDQNGDRAYDIAKAGNHVTVKVCTS